MHPFIRNVIALVIGLVAGSLLNMSIIMISGSIIPPPAGADLTTTEGLKAAMALMEPRHFIMPFLAHALGTFVGAFIAAKLATTNKMNFASLIGALFLMGGVANIFMLPSPLWFTILDLAGAYFPMAFIAGKLAMCKK